MHVVKNFNLSMSPPNAFFTVKLGFYPSAAEIADAAAVIQKESGLELSDIIIDVYDDWGEDAIKLLGRREATKEEIQPLLEGQRQQKLKDLEALKSGLATTTQRIKRLEEELNG